MSAIFLVAKYLPDLERQEPRNIGVIAWSRGRVFTKFIEADNIDFVADLDNYRRWIAHWNRLANEPRIQVYRERPATKRSIRFIKQIQMTQDGNYRLQDGGEIPDATTENLDEAARFIYSRIVAPVRTPAVEREPSLTAKCAQVLKDAGIAFERRYPVILRFTGFEQEIHFDFGSQNSLFNKVNLSEENSVTLAAGKCETAIRYGKRSRERCFSLYDAEVDSDVSQSVISFLGQFSVPLDLSDPETPPRLRRVA
jgi:hypothetical protein